jgi:predicted metal-dependent phosphoesterase TrpH
MIDLHLHTSASDGRHAPRELVDLVVAAGIRVMSVTDHDTVAAHPEAAAAAAALGVGFVPGIELTTVWNGRDVHVLGYFLRSDDEHVAQLVATQRQARLERARTMVALLDRAGAPIDIARRLEAAVADRRSIARPELARALVQAGHAASVADAFDRFLSEGRPAFVPHCGPSPMQALAAIHAAGGLVSLAHPGLLRDSDDLLCRMRDDGLDGIEAYHSEQDPATQARYALLAREWGLAVTGGSDFHGDGRPGRDLGRASLPPAAFADLLDRAGARASTAVQRSQVRIRTF